MPDREKTLGKLKSELASLQGKISELENGSQSDKRKTVKTLFRWQSFSRTYTRRSAKWYIYTFLLLATIILILLFVREFFIIIPVLALVFVAYSLATVPPEIVNNSITSQGINNGNYSYIWQELDDFWFTEKNGFTILHIDTFLNWPRRLFILVNKDDKEKIQQMLARYIPYREIPKTTWIDTFGEVLLNGLHKLTS
ncbi:MAG: hypothetical protein A2172_00715 [Candidatus Woykebacteria bacterium RBG_13_40_15]|uniref:Uncharacterized protein n=1 Tax=Candidatus Woykebacteria bacterium RBG_13_40_15 TaxID=1802593 RepID=A0A1G1W8R3_9BACT|nr:MAG: hypothetical protein A2172_00715 [Candidatus Woykebacteria bacterium RBG_13_40_15]